MIDISTLNPIVQTKLKNDPFNYEASDPLKTTFNVPKFDTIVLENDRKIVLEVLENEEFLSWLAEKLGKSYPIVKGYVTNKRQPTLEVLYTIAEILDVEISDLLTSKKIAIKN